jgi:hypothetical protein
MFTASKLTPLEGDYVSPGLQTIGLDFAFPDLISGMPPDSPWNWLDAGVNSGVTHRWYASSIERGMGIMNRDEVQLLYNWALRFAGQQCLEVGCWIGWSTVHLLAAGVNLDVIDPILGHPTYLAAVNKSIWRARERCELGTANLLHDVSPVSVVREGRHNGKRWGFIIIDADHSAPAPMIDAAAAEVYAAENAAILFHDAWVPDVAQAVQFLRYRGWKTIGYRTSNGMAAAYRGTVEPVPHVPDPTKDWRTDEMF